ncbi:MAG: hypothetical protein RSP_24880 [Rhodanobacter sp.]
MHLNRIAFLALAMLTLAACQQESAPPVSAQSKNGAGSNQTIAAKSSPAISIDPATMKSCDGIAATVHWDASKVGTNTDSTEIWVGPSDSDTKLFSAGGATGDTQTGPWTHPGTHFLLKNKQDGKVLGEAIVGGPACS